MNRNELIFKNSASEFENKSLAGPYGDAIMELDYSTGEILDAINAAGIN